MADTKGKWPPRTQHRHHGNRVEVTPGTTPVIDSPSSVVSRPNGPNAQIIQTNILTTPVLLAVLGAFGVTAFVSASALLWAKQADDKSVIAEREARLAQNRYDTLQIDVKVMRMILEQQGLKLPEEAER